MVSIELTAVPVRADEQAEIAHSVADAQALDLGPASPLSQANLSLR